MTDRLWDESARVAVFCAVAVTVAFLPAAATTWTPGGIHYWSVNGHYYQRWSVSEYPESFTYADIESFVNTLSYQGLRGHLATFTSIQELLDVPGMATEKGLVGAVGDNTATGYVWDAGPDVGVPVVMWGIFFPGLPDPCGPYDRVWIRSGTDWYAEQSRQGCRFPGDVRAFSVEYESWTTSVEPGVGARAWGRMKSLYR